MINIIQIKDLDAPELQIYYNLNEAQLFHYFEPKPGIFIAESPKVIERALDAGCVPMSFLMEKKHVETQAKEILARCDKLQSRDLTQESLVYREDEHVIPVYVAEVEMLAKITGYQLTRGMLCAMYRPALSSVEQLCKNARRVAILENVVNPTNVGAIFRSAAALGMDAVLLTQACADPLYRRASRVSMGTVFQIPWTYFDKSASWPNAAAVLGPPTRAMEPQPIPSSGSRPKSAITPPPRKFCSGIITMEMARHRMTALPPLSSAGILTVKPTVVKNMIIKTVCSVASKLMDAMPME